MVTNKTDEDLREYRATLVVAEQKAQEDYDKTVLSLSGGALGVSFAFLKDIIGDKPATASWCLFLAWMAWGLSAACVLASYYCSQQALRKTIKQVDAGKIYEELPGGRLSVVTAYLNAVGALLFLVGVVSISIFVAKNMR